MYKYLLIFCLTINVSFASGARLIDFLVTSSGVSEMLAKKGLAVGPDSKELQSYVASSLKALGVQNGSSSKDQLMRVLGSLPPGTKQEIDRNKDLQKLLESDIEALKKDQVVSAINSLIYFANKNGKSTVITCAECVNDTLAKQGFKFSIDTVKNAKTANLLDNVIPKDSAQLNSFIAGRMKRNGMGDYNKVAPGMVAPEEEKSLALFLELAEKGTPEQKALIGSIKKLSTRNGQTNIVDTKNPHKFWKVLADDMSSEELSGWTKTLSEVGDRATKDGVTAEEAFYRTLKEKADGNEYLTKQYETLKAKRCFFK